MLLKNSLLPILALVFIVSATLYFIFGNGNHQVLKFNSIKTGDSREEVIEALGKPDDVLSSEKGYQMIYRINDYLGNGYLIMDSNDRVEAIRAPTDK